MKAKQRKHAWWISIAGLLVIAAAVTSLLVMAEDNDITFTATAYSDVIRFAANGVGSLQIRIYDMSENELWDSGQVTMDYADWDRTNEWGERLANGYYIYFVQGWSNADELVLAKTGKVVLLPGDQVQLQSAPSVSAPVTGDGDSSPWRDSPIQLGPMAVDVDHSSESWAFGQVGIGTTNPSAALTVNGNINFSSAGDIRQDTSAGSDNRYVRVYGGGLATETRGAGFGLYGNNFTNYAGTMLVQAGNVDNGGTYDGRIRFSAGNVDRMTILRSGNVGIGTTSPNEQLEITGNLRLPATTATTGIIYAAGNRFIHSYGSFNTFVGEYAGNFTLSGGFNTGVGNWALGNNSGAGNTAVGAAALSGNQGGGSNTALGREALTTNTSGSSNTAAGSHALYDNTTGAQNTAVGDDALRNSGGGNNTALGYAAGSALTSGSYNIYIGNSGTSSESNTIRIGSAANQTKAFIAGVSGVLVTGGSTVYIDGNGQLGNLIASSRRFKHQIEGLGSRSRVIYDLNPVSFLYNGELDSEGQTQYGLIAEEVAEAAPDLVIYDEAGQPLSVRYEQLVPLLLNELQVKNAKDEAQQAQIDAQQDQIDQLLARLGSLEEEVDSLRD